MCVALAQLTDNMDPMYIIPKELSGPHNDAYVIVFLVVPILATRGPKNVFFRSSSAHRQDGPQVYYTKMTGYLDIHETFFIFLFQT